MNSQEKIRKNKYKSFEDTFPICSMGLFLSCVYPKPVNDNMFKRISILFFIYISFAPALALVVFDIFHSIEINDMGNCLRQLINMVVTFLYAIKTFLICLNGKTLRKLLNVTSNDLVQLNKVSEENKGKIQKYIKLAKQCELLMLMISIVFASLYFVVSLVTIMISYLLTDAEIRRHSTMVNPLIIQTFEDKQFKSPYFELLWIYQTIICFAMAPCYVGIDGSFGITCAHASLKFKLIIYKLHNIFETSTTEKEVKIKLKSVIVDHTNALNFYKTIQHVYQDWLLFVYILSFSILSVNLYEMSTSESYNPLFLIFLLCAIIHVFIPCYYASIISEVIITFLSNFVCLATSGAYISR